MDLNIMFWVLLLVWMIFDLIAMYQLKKEVKTLREWFDILCENTVKQHYGGDK